MERPSAIDEAAEVLRRGGLVAFPTETVYGLGADASDARAVRRIYQAKGRPPSHPVIVHLASAGQIGDWAATVPDDARAVAEAFWPGPLTLVLPRRSSVPDEVTGGTETVGLRVPGHDLALALLRAFGGGVAAPSANRFGRVSPTTAAAVREEFADEVDLVLDGGPCPVGVESTVVDATGRRLRILRPGAVTGEMMGEVVGYPVVVGEAGSVRAPGTLPAHYAPAARVELVELAGVAERSAELAAAGAAVGLVSPEVPPEQLAEGVRQLAVLPTAADYARGLYEALRSADRLGMDVVLAVAPPPGGIADAVIDRLTRAAASTTAPL
jgi:L-threonylcarbamoyladenylate synthase